MYIIPLTNKKAFTLIEMLIVIVIIGILAAALIPRLQSVQGRARDTKRKTDLRQIFNATQIFYTDMGDYPAATSASGACAVNALCSTYSYISTNWLNNFTGILTSYPLDPLNTISVNADEGGPWHTGNYIYRYGNVKNTPVDTYDLTAQLENRNDPDRCGVKNYSFLYPTNPWCPPFAGTWSHQIYELSPDSNSY